MIAFSAGSTSMCFATIGVLPEVMIARTSDSSDALNDSAGGLPLVSIRSKRSAKRAVIALGKRE
jgi:hypothetical protein